MKLLVVSSFLFLISAFLYLGAVQAKDVDGFLSLDCGLEPKEATTLDTGTQLTFLSDLNFIDTGKSTSVKPEYKIRNSERLWWLRFFPHGVRNCYNLNLTAGQKYLVRASFTYGDYDSKDVIPSFGLYLGPHLWSQVEKLNKSKWQYKELIHVLPSKLLQVCLHRSAPTFPFISSLEVRLISDQIYNISLGPLNTIGRWYFLAKDIREWIRYPDDTLDRGWIGWYNENWRIVSTENDVDTSTSEFQVPQSVIKTAATPKNPKQPLRLSFDVENYDSDYYFYMHFADIEPLKRNESRQFQIKINGDIWQESFIPNSFRSFTLYSGSPSKAKNGKFEIEYEMIGNSTRPPLLNALEVYQVLKFSGPVTDANDVEALYEIKSYYGIKRSSWQGDPCAPPNVKWDGVDCSSNDSPRIISLNLSSSGLKGEISHHFSKLSNLVSLDMSNNELSGKIPPYLAAMQKLNFINVSSNELDASIPDALRKRQDEGSLTLVVAGNKVHHHKSLIISIAASAAAATLLVACLVLLYIHNKRKRRTPSDQQNCEEYTGPWASIGPSIKTKDRRFSFSDIIKITNNFETRLAEGGFGTVYLGYLNDINPVAVKMLSQSSMQGYKEFKAEVEVLLRVHHKNLVTLVGYCDQGDKLALIYEYMANRDLKALLLAGKIGRDILSWKTRLEIAVQVAQGLEYLHVGCNPPMIHRDVKTRNILLNEQLEAKLGDFGLARSFPNKGKNDHVSTIIVGTPGYLDPEYYKTNQLTVKSDIYSFGIVLLEIITNQSVINKARNQQHIVEWITHALEVGDIQGIIDPNMSMGFDEKSAWNLLKVAMLCVEDSHPSKRPSISYVLQILNESLSLERRRLLESQEICESSKSLELSIPSTSEASPTTK